MDGCYAVSSKTYTSSLPVIFYDSFETSMMLRTKLVVATLVSQIKRNVSRDKTKQTVSQFQA